MAPARSDHRAHLALKQWSIAHRALRRLGDLDALVERRRAVGQRGAASGGAANT
jgi:hypothetical protein